MLELHLADSDLQKAFDWSKLASTLKEPRKEEDLKKPVKDYLKDEWDVWRVAAEVPLDPKAPRASTRADIIGFKKVMLGFGKQAYAVELKSSSSRGDVRQAFAQAKEDQRFCEYSTVCFSPMVYMNYIEMLDRELKDEQYEGIGVWLANSERVLYELRKPTMNEVRERDREPVFDWIASHEY
jgi:hypothetical protein